VEIKKKLRAELSAEIASAPINYLDESGAGIIKTLLASDEYAAARVIFTYVGVGPEIPTLPLARACLRDGKRVCVPKTYPHGIMNAVEIFDENNLELTPRGLLEPADENAKIIMPEEIDFVIVPCLSCDPFGNRIGYGGGYYDRYLKQLNSGAKKFAVCRKRFLSMNLPHNENDVRMDGYISEGGLYFSLPEEISD
jgi:5-formyltetrahydrofolate cyclo-ligase